MRDYWWVMFGILGLAFSQWVSGSNLCAGFFLKQFSVSAALLCWA